MQSLSFESWRILLFEQKLYNDTVLYLSHKVRF